MPETDETPTPLWALPAKWRERWAGSATMTHELCARELEAALNAFDVEPALNGLLLKLAEIDNAGLDGSRWMLQRREAIAAALRAAAAAQEAEVAQLRAALEDASARARDGFRTVMLLLAATKDHEIEVPEIIAVGIDFQDWEVERVELPERDKTRFRLVRAAIAPAGPEEETK